MKAFVSSTYVDLKEARSIVSAKLLEAGYQPVGMENFPATPEDRWAYIKRHIDECDLYVLILGGRYGSISTHPEHAGLDVSWTEAEYDYAVAKGTYVIALVHGEPGALRADASDRDPTKVDAFRAKIAAAKGLYKPWTNDSELLSGILTALFEHKGRISGWSDFALQPGSRHPAVDEFMRESFDRTYELLQIHWAYTPAVAHADKWDARYRAVRSFVPNWPEGVSLLSISQGSPGGGFTAFDTVHPPELRVLSYTVTPDLQGAEARARKEPRTLNPTNFRHDIDLVPPVPQGSLATVELEIALPGVRYAYLEDLVAATRNASTGSRTYQVNSFRITYDAKRLVLSAFFPDVLGVTSIEVLCRKTVTLTDHDETRRLRTEGLFTLTRDTQDGLLGTLATIDVPNPRNQRTYEIRFNPPSRPA